MVGDRRTEAEFATFLDQLLATTSPRVSWHMVCDRLQLSIDSCSRMAAKLALIGERAK